MRAGQLGQLQLVQDGDHPGLGVGQLGLGVVPVLDHPGDPFERGRSVRAAPRRGRPGRRTGCAGSAGRGVTLPRRVTSLRTACSNRAGPRRRVRVRSPPSRSMTTVIAATQVVGLERLLGGLQRRRATRTRAGRGSAARTRRAPRAAARGGCRGAAAGPRSRRPVRAGSSAAARSAGRSAPRPCRRSCRVVRSSVLRAHDDSAGCTHTNDMPRSVGELAQHPPPVPGRLTRHRHPGEPGPRVLARRPSPARRRGPTPCTGTCAGPGPWSRGRSPPPSACDRPGRSRRSRCVTGTAARSLRKPCVPVPIPTRDTTTVVHERPPSCALGHQARQAHQEDVPNARPKTLNVFLCRCAGTSTTARRHRIDTRLGGSGRSVSAARRHSDRADLGMTLM